MKASAYCTTKTVEQAEHIIGELKAAGFMSNDKDVFKRNHADDISTGSEASPK